MPAGRPSKSEVLVYRMAFRDELDQVLKSGYVRLDDRYGIDEGSGVTAKMEAIQASVAKAYDDAGKNLNARSFDEAVNHPWLSSVDAVTYGRQLMQQHWVCQRIIEVLESHLVEQILVQASIQRKLNAVRKQVDDQIQVVPEAIVQFARRLHHLGLKASSVRDLRNDDVSLIADMFNSQDASAMSSVFRPGRKPMKDDEREELIDNARRTETERAAARPPEPEPSPVFPNVPPPPIHPPGTEWLDTSTAAPPEFFDGIDDVGLPYRWQYRDATEAEAKSVLDLPMPPQDSWERLKQFDLRLAQAMELRSFIIEDVEDVIRTYVGFRGKISSDDVPDNWVKAWILLLLARPNPEIMPLLLKDRLDSYFDGVMLPVTSMGSGRIRELVRIAA